MQMSCTAQKTLELLTISRMHMGAANLVHQQHENKAQYERNTDVGMELCVVMAVLMVMGNRYFCFVWRNHILCLTRLVVFP